MANIAARVDQTPRSFVTDEATKIVSDGNLHQWLWLPQTSSHERLRVTFSTTNNFSNASLPTLLFCGPMFCSRWMTLDMNRLAVKHGVRVICTDRPGVGGSSRVPLNLRVQVWLETIPVLLEKLDVDHIGLFCHSTGVIYALNTLYYLRDILDPRAPFIACMGPWVNNEHPHTALMKVAAKVPNGLFDYWHSVIKIAQQHIVPAASWSGGIVSSMVERTNSESSTLANKYGTTEEVGKEIERLRNLYLFQEDISGADSDARLCLRKEGYGNWGICEDYADFVRKLVKLEQERPVLLPNQPRLKVHAYFAASDVMIGKDGQNYFEQSWQQHGVERFIHFESWTLDDTTHDSLIIDLKKGPLEAIFDYYARSTMVEEISCTQLEPIRFEIAT